MSRQAITEEMVTAYALGELDDRDREAVEAHIADNAEARRQLQEVRATEKLLTDELGKELAEERMPVRLIAEPARRFQALRRRWVMTTAAVAASVAVTVGAVSFFTPSLNRAREVSTRNRLSPDGHVEFQNTPFTDMRDSGAAPTPGFRDHRPVQPGMYPGMAAYPGMMPGMAASAAPGSSNPTNQLDSILLPSDDLTTGVPQPVNTEGYASVVDNGFLRVADQPLSTFSIDVDTASYSNVRRFLTQNMLPPKDAVRIEEMINYFPYNYDPPPGEGPGAPPFAARVEVAGCPWATSHRLVRVALKGREVARDKRPASNLVFLVDVSGSMQPDNKLPLVKQGLRMLTAELNENDRVAIVVYAGSTGLALPSTPGNEKGTILGAINALGAGGSTNGAGGIDRAYQEAVRHFVKGGVNRVLLCTDGDFNVGITDQDALTHLIEEKATTGVFLSVLGFGMGNLKDATMERLADKGNGNYAYVDTAAEARKVLVEQMSGTLVTIAKDVKTQVEFNPAKVSSYRLIGYENRLLAKEDFNDDRKDAGEIGAGHTVTALYEVVPVGAGEPADASAARPAVDALKYQKPAAGAGPALEPTGSGELLTVKLRYKEPDGAESKLLEFPVTDGGATYARASGEFKFAASVAAFGMILRESPHKGGATFGTVLELAHEGLGRDDGGYRAEFLALVQKAKALRGHG
jgi:Ca-activated chloride channel homolog